MDLCSTKDANLKQKKQQIFTVKIADAYGFEAKLFYLTNDHECLKSVRHHSMKFECSEEATLPTTCLCNTLD